MPLALPGAAGSRFADGAHAIEVDARSQALARLAGRKHPERRANSCVSPVRLEEILSLEEKETESLLLALRRSQGANVSEFKPVLSRQKETVEELKAKGLISIDTDWIRLTARGQLFAETVFTELST